MTEPKLPKTAEKNCEDEEKQASEETSASAANRLEKEIEPGAGLEPTATPTEAAPSGEDEAPADNETPPADGPGENVPPAEDAAAPSAEVSTAAAAAAAEAETQPVSSRQYSF